jgi:hypothetical protein
MIDLDSLPDGEYTAVVDSIEDGYATVFFEHDGEEVEDAIIEATELPETAQHADAILSVTVKNGSLTEIEYKPERTVDRAEQAQSRFDRLSQRPPSEEDS